MTIKEQPQNEGPYPPAKPEVASRRPHRRVLEVNLEEKGMALAIESGVTEPHPEHTQMLTGLAQSMSAEDWEDRWDPKGKPSDALLAEEHDRNIKERGEIEKQIRQRQAEHREAGDGLAAVAAAGDKPTISWSFKAVITLIMALSMSPTLRDELFASVEDNILGWMAAIGVGCCFGIAVVSATLLVHRGEFQDAQH
jgi:hypothetical protein